MFETLTGETRSVQLKFFKRLLFVLKRIFFSISITYLKSETCLNFSNFDRQDFIKIQNSTVITSL